MNTSFAKSVSPGLSGKEETSVKDKLSKIRAKLRSGARLSGEEKEVLRANDPGFYQKVMELEKEAAAYEERLKKSRTRDEAEQAKTEKLGQIAADLNKEAPEYSFLRLMRMQEAERKMASTISRKPWRREIDQKKLEEERRLRKKEEEKARQRRARQKRREEAVRKEKIEKEIRQEKALEEDLLAERIEEERVQEAMEEERVLDRLEEEDITSEMMTGRAIVEEQIAKFMIAAGMMDLQATRVQVAESPELAGDPADIPPSLGSSTGYAAYRAAAYMPEFADREIEKKPYIRRA